MGDITHIYTNVLIDSQHNVKLTPEFRRCRIIYDSNLYYILCRDFPNIPANTALGRRLYAPEISGMTTEKNYLRWPWALTVDHLFKQLDYLASIAKS